MEIFSVSSWVVFVALGVVVTIFLLLFIFASRYVKVGPNEVLIISGRRRKVRDADGTIRTVGYRIVKGGGTFIWPVFEKTNTLSLELMTLDVNTPEIYTIKGVPIIVDGIAQIKVGGDDVSIATAAEQFLSKKREQIMGIALQTVEGHLRSIIGTLTVEEAYFNRDMFAQKVQEVAAQDLANMGLSIVSFTVRDIRDKEGYLDALGKPRIAQVKRDAAIAEAEALRDSTIRSAQANQAAQTEKFLADTKIAESNKDYQVKVAEYTASVNQKKAEADLAYDLQKYKVEQNVKKEQVQIEVVEKDMHIQVQEKEILRKEKELNATIEKPADAEKYKIQTLAEAEKHKKQTIAEGEASAIKLTGFADAEAEKAKGLAKAEIIRAQGTSEAEAMLKKAEAWQNYNQAAIGQMIIEKLPEIVKSIAEPLSKTEKIVIVNTGGGNSSLGASKVTKDIVDIVAQVPPVIEALTGMKFDEILANLPKIGEKKDK